MWSCHSYLHWYAVKVPHSPGVVCSENFFGHGRRGKKFTYSHVQIPRQNGMAERMPTRAAPECPQSAQSPKKEVSQNEMESDEARVLFMLLCFPKQNIGKIQQVLVTKIDALKNILPPSKWTANDANA